jgi:hypothetical protein
MRKQTAKLIACLSLLCGAQLIAPYAVWSASPGASMNLSSTAHTVSAGSINGFHPTTITAGGAPQSVNSTTMLTPAEVQAVMQVLATGHQSLILSPSDAGIGGSLVVNQTAGAVSSVVVPSGVSLVDHLGNANNILSVTGSLTNAGSLYLAGSSNATSLSISANSINNTGLLASLVGGINLTLNAVRSITNTGTIQSAGDLNLTAGSITNGMGGTLQAANNVNLSAGSGTYTNAGSVIASTGNINFINPGAQTNISLVGSGGVLQALQGSINFRDASYTGSGNITLTDGDFLSTAVNLFAGSGTIEGNVGNVTGTVNLTAGNAQLNANTANLKMGTWTVGADPLLTNTGNVDISALKAVSGSDFLIIAGGNIDSSSGSFVINTSSTKGNGGNVMLVAGANFKGGTISGASSSGGSINLLNISGSLINTSSTAANSSAGSVTLIAFPNADNSSGGTISLAPSSTIITNAAAGKGSNGNVLVIAGGQIAVATPTTIQLGNITTAINGGASAGGTITIDTSTPNATAVAPVVLNTSTAAITKGSFLGGELQSGTISVNNLTTIGQSVNLVSGSNSSSNPAISANTINTSSLSGSGGSVILNAGVVSNSGSNDSDVNVANITTGASSSSSTGGSVTITTPGNILLTSVSGNAIDTSGATGANGGNVLLVAGGSGGQNVTVSGINTSGNIGGNVSVFASGNILINQSAGTPAFQISTNGSNTAGTAGNITLVAGAATSVGTSIAVTGASSSGGNISFANSTDTLDATGFNGGNTTLAAYAAGANNGLIMVPNSINTQGAVTNQVSGISGNVQIVAGAASTASNPTSITLSDINTASGGQGGGGSVSILTAQPGSNVVFSSSNGNVTSGNLMSGTTVAGAVTVNDISTTGGNVTITAGSNATASPAITLNSISTSGVPDPTAATPIQGNSQSGGNITLIAGTASGSGNQSIAINSTITSLGVGASAEGGAVIAIVNGSINASAMIDTGDSTSASTGAIGGHVLFNAGTNTTEGNIVFDQVETAGAGGAAVQMIASGDITSSSSTMPIDTHANISPLLTNTSGGNVLLVAGALATVGSVTTNITGPSSFGGNISMKAVSGTAVFTGVTVNGINGSGGTVSLGAFSRGGGGTIIISGDIDTTSNISGSAFTSPNSQNTLINRIGGSGNVVVVAGSGDTSQFTIQLANINTVGTVNGAGSVSIVTANPNASTASPISINNSGGTLLSGTFLGNATQNGSVSVGNISTNGGNVLISVGASNSSGFALNAGNISTNASTALTGMGGNGGFVTINAVASTNEADLELRNITSYGITLPQQTNQIAPIIGNGGLVSIITPGSITVGNIDTGDNFSAGISSSATTGANGGSVMMLAGTSSTVGSITFGSIETKGGTNVNGQAVGNGGSVVLISLGDTGNITSTGSIVTDIQSANGSAIAGPVAISTANGSININSISAVETGANTNGGADILLSTGISTTGAAVTASVSTTSTESTFVFVIPTATTSVSGNNVWVSTSIASLPAGNPNTAPSPQAMPTGANQLQFNAGTSPSVQAFNGVGTAENVFYSPGGFTSISDASNFVALTVTGDSKLIVPIVSLAPTGISLTNLSLSSLTSSMPILLAGTSVNVQGSLTTTAALSAIASGTISFVSIPLPTNSGQSLVLGTVVTPQSFIASMGNGTTSSGNISLSGPIVAPSVTLTAVNSSGQGGFIQYLNNITQPIITNNFVASASLTVGQSNVPLLLFSSADAINVSGITAEAMYLNVVGNIYVNNLTTTTTFLVPGNPAQQINTQGNILIETEPYSGNGGSITLAGTINAPNGYIALLAAGSITTAGSLPVTISADGKQGGSQGPGGGNLIYLIAGADVVNVPSNSQIAIPSRSGEGGDISLPLLSSLSAFTDNQGNGGQINMVAFSATAVGFVGGNISYPSTTTVGVYNPPFSNPSSGSQINIIGEAQGGPSSATTINIGNVYGGAGSVFISTTNPNASAASPFVLDTGSGTESGSGFIPTNQGQVQTNSSIQVGQISVLGVLQGSPQSINVTAGGSLTTGSLIAVGAAGSTPQPFAIAGIVQVDPLVPNTLAAFSGGRGGNITVFATEQVLINGDILSFGGGGGGGLGAPFNAEGGVSAGAQGGAGGVGGNGGNISINSNNSSITVTGSINSSGGGGGGGGGGFAGTGTGDHAGGAGGAGGQAGNISLLASASPGSTIAVGGPVYAAAGAQGGTGGTGEVLNSINFGGSGGGGGGSFGAGGGGGGGAVSETNGKNESGFGGAGGGGIYGGGGGDIQNLLVAGGNVSFTGFGGWGGGGLLNSPTSNPTGNIQPGPAGGANNNGAISNGVTLTFAGSPGALNAGGDGGTYNANGTTGGTPVKPAAIGGALGNGGAGGAPGDPGFTDGGGGTGSDTLNGQGIDGIVTMSAYSFTTPSVITAGDIQLTAKGDTTTQASGSLTISGNMIATGSPNLGNVPTFSADQAGTAGGNLIITPSTTINVYNGKIQIENDNPNGTINIGANSLIFDNGDNSASIIISMGIPTNQQTPAVAPVVGKSPADVTVISSTSSVPPNNIFFGNAGFTASGAKNIVYALGNGAQVEFQSGWFTGLTTFGTSKSIQLGGGVQIGAASALPLTNLDLTNSNTVQTIETDQANHVIGGTLKFTDVNGDFMATGGTIILYPVNLTNTITALNIPAPPAHIGSPLSVTLTNFTQATPITILRSASSIAANNSPTKDVTIDSPLIFNGTVAVDGILIVSSNLGPNFLVGSTGSISSTGNLSIIDPGAMTISGPIAVAGTLNLATTSGAGITLAANVTGTKGVTLTADGTVANNEGAVALQSGTLASTGVIDLVSAQLNITAAKISDADGTVVIEPNDPTLNISVTSTNNSTPFNITTSDLLAITAAKTVQIGSQADFGSITVSVPMNVTSAKVANGVGAFNLDFETTGSFTSTTSPLTMSTKDLTINAGSADVGTVSGGAVDTINASTGDITLASGIQGTATSTTLVLSAPEGTITGAPTLIGKSLTIGAGAAAVTTNAATLAFTSGDVTVTDTSATVTTGTSSGHNITVDDSTAKAKVTVGKAINANDLTIDLSGAPTSGSIAVGANITAAQAVSLTASGTGTITQTAKTLIVASTGLSLTAATGAFGTAGAPIITSAPTVSASTTGAAFVTDSATGLTVNANGLGALTIASTATGVGAGVTVNNNNTTSTFTLNSSSANGTFQLITCSSCTGAVNVGGITVNGPSSSSTGSGIVISSIGTSAGAININGNLADVGGGSSGYGILIQSANVSTGAINVKAGAKLTTVAVGSAKTNADIALVIAGSVQKSNPVQTTLPGFTITGGTGLSSGAQVFQGPNPSQISVPTGTAKIQLVNANLIFDVNSTTAKITIGSGTLFNPDPTTTTTVSPGSNHPVSSVIIDDRSSAVEIVVDTNDDADCLDVLVDGQMPAVSLR